MRGKRSINFKFLEQENVSDPSFKRLTQKYTRYQSRSSQEIKSFGRQRSKTEILKDMMDQPISCPNKYIQANKSQKFFKKAHHVGLIQKNNKIQNPQVNLTELLLSCYSKDSLNIEKIKSAKLSSKKQQQFCDALVKVINEKYQNQTYLIFYKQFVEETSKKIFHSKPDAQYSQEMKKVIQMTNAWKVIKQLLAKSLISPEKIIDNSYLDPKDKQTIKNILEYKKEKFDGRRSMGVLMMPSQRRQFIEIQKRSQQQSIKLRIQITKNKELQQRLSKSQLELKQYKSLNKNMEQQVNDLQKTKRQSQKLINVLLEKIKVLEEENKGFKKKIQKNEDDYLKQASQLQDRLMIIKQLKKDRNRLKIENTKLLSNIGEKESQNFDSILLKQIQDEQKQSIKLMHQIKKGQFDQGKFKQAIRKSLKEQENEERKIPFYDLNDLSNSVEDSFESSISAIRSKPSIKITELLDQSIEEDQKDVKSEFKKKQSDKILIM